MNQLLSFLQSIVVFVSVITAPVTKAIIPLNHITQPATPSGEIRKVVPIASASLMPVSQQPQKENSKEEQVARDVIRAEDDFDYMNQKATFYIDLPKNGGKISGKITGLCNGTVTGDFNGQTSTENVDSNRNDIVGEATGTCNVGFIPVPASAKFFGQVLLSSPFKRVILTVDIEKPIQTRAYPVMRIW